MWVDLVHGLVGLFHQNHLRSINMTTDDVSFLARIARPRQKAERPKGGVVVNSKTSGVAGDV